MNSKKNRFHKKLMVLAMALVFQPAFLYAQVDGNRLNQDATDQPIKLSKSQAAAVVAQSRQPILVLPDLGDSSSASLTPVDERKLGERIMREIRRDPDYSADPVFYDYLNGIGHQLVDAARKQGVAGLDGKGTFALNFELFGVKDRSINAFALPGGFLGVHTGLIVAAETESELASVLGHEIGHVTQKHIARMYGQQGTNSMIALASIVLAVVAASRNPNAAQGLAVGGQALAIQNQLAYSRDAEREADRVGFQILQAGGFDVQGMPDFFNRMQRANSIMESGVPGYVRTHPLTTDRIADMQDRVRGIASRKVPSSVEFYLLKARARLIQATSTSTYPDLRQLYESLSRKPDLTKQIEGYYGLALLNLKEQKIADAEANLVKTRNALQALTANGSPIQRWSLAVEATSIDIMFAKSMYEPALKQLNTLRAGHPSSRTFNLLTIEAQLKLKQFEPAITWLKRQTRLYSDDSVWWGLLSMAYAQSGKIALQHASMAEKYVADGAWVAAMEQMRLAKASGDADFYQSSEIDARARQIQELYRQELKDQGKVQ
ncbi:M48 family metallopeptidase [Polynucleobacter sp. MWH-Spelu-300-X4]|uniref:M48 family metallopeptidase n=1 Tax=Polynucleobacter sp. MWH-Spelu-300-X4 TaxID=2689109 RepID=UPI001BFE6E98|nr:M48 family metalloprotease [Polynucleobacter sp. MWH-Spelu-300-X4]QWD79565.1 M48 family metallopeptidase [Polynucleobacter sp. MWH-Spelu-300-X4]